MTYPEIQKYFGTPLEELTKPDTIKSIKSNATFYGFLAGSAFAAILFVSAYYNGYLDHLLKLNVNYQGKKPGELTSFPPANK